MSAGDFAHTTCSLTSNLLACEDHSLNGNLADKCGTPENCKSSVVSGGSGGGGSNTVGSLSATYSVC